MPKKFTRKKSQDKGSSQIIRLAKISSRWPVFIVSILGAACSAMIILTMILKLPALGSYAEPVSAVSNNPLGDTSVESLWTSALVKQTSLGIPTRLVIPKLKVDATVDSVGLTRQGAVGVPQGPSTVAWFNLGPQPGENGNAVITGHYGPWITGQRSVFDNINKLRKGDKLYIKDDKGSLIAFVVREIRLYTLKTDASAVFISTDGKAHLNLITCEGVWSKVTRSYSQRLVVFADEE